MTVAREIMTPDVECVGEQETVVQAAKMMRDLDVGALPIKGENERITGMITDRDIAIGCVAAGEDPASVRVGALTGERVLTVGPDEDVEEALRTMAEHQVRRLPVVDGAELVGMISQADVALAIPAERAGAVLAAISE